MGRPLLRDEVPVGTCKVRALYSWSGESPQDLGFVEGDIIEVLNNGDGDWWTGKLKRNKLVGIFPRNFAEYVDPNQETMCAAAKTAPRRRKSALDDFHLESLDIDASGSLYPSDPVADLQISEAPTTNQASGDPLSNSVSTTESNAEDRHRLVPLNTAMQTSTNSTSSALKLSTGSTRSTHEILDDVGAELNMEFLDDIRLDVNAEDLRADGPPRVPKHSVLSSSQNSSTSCNNSHSRSLSLVPESPVKLKKRESREHRKIVDAVEKAEKSAERQFEKVQHERKHERKHEKRRSSRQESKAEKEVQEERKSSALTGPVIKKPAGATISGNTAGTAPGLGVGYGIMPDGDLLDDPNGLPNRAYINSPLLDKEVPFDPRAFKPENPIPDHIGSHFDTSTYSSGPIDDSVVINNKPHETQVPSSNAASASSEATVFFPPVREEKKQNFFQKLFPKNTQKSLRRTFSRTSMKSSKSAKSVTSRLKNMKSMFSFAPSFQPDEKLYPANNTVSVKRISTPPRNTNVTSTYATTSKLKASLGSSQGSAGSKSKLSEVSAGPTLVASTKEAAWIESRRDLYRAQTLTERDIKKRRQELELQGVNCDNLVRNLNTLATSDEFHDYRLEAFDEVDQAVLTMSTWPQLMTPSVFASSRIGRHFADPLDRVRAVFLLCATRITHVAQTPQPNNVMQTRTASASELAATVVAMCTGLDIECIAVEGHMRSVQGKTIQSKPHVWNAVKVNDEWRLLDTVTAAASRRGEEEEEEFVNLFYFMAPPVQLIFSHVPLNHHHQFYEPALPTASAALLPLASPAAFAHNILFDSFWLGLARLSDLEVCELMLQVRDTTNDLVAIVDGQYAALSQPVWRDDDTTRFFRVKAFVPQHNKQALLQLYVVPKSQSDRSPESMELVWTVELRHVSGEKNNVPFEFIGRYATPTVPEHDLYVLEPQCKALGGGNSYTFRIESFGNAKKQAQISVQSPSGRLTRMVPFGTDVHDTFKASVKTLEVGTWRAVVRASETESWVPFAEWFCS